MFMYESLRQNQKEMIDSVIEERVKQLIVDNGGFEYSDSQFENMVYEIIFHNETVNLLLGNNSQPFFNIKEIVIKSRAIKIAYDLENNRPSKELVLEYIELCEKLNIDLDIEVLFSVEYVEELVYAFKHHLKKSGEHNCEKVVDNTTYYDYTISSNTKSFVSLLERFYTK